MEVDQTDLIVLKTPKPDTTGIKRAKLNQEGRILAALRHPYIVAYLAQTTRPTPGILVRYCAGGSLRDRIRWHQVHGIAISEGMIHRILRHTLLALHHLHTAHGDRPVVVHRAISPEKLLFDRDNNVVLAGLGHASHHPPRGQFLQGNIANETYAAPEMRLGRKYGPLVDIYALGCIVHECCTLRSPFLTCLTQEASSERARTIPLAYSLDLRQVIAAVLRFDPATRPTAGQLLATSPIALYLSE